MDTFLSFFKEHNAGLLDQVTLLVCSSPKRVVREMEFSLVLPFSVINMTSILSVVLESILLEGKGKRLVGAHGIFQGQGLHGGKSTSAHIAQRTYPHGSLIAKSQSNGWARLKGTSSVHKTIFFIFAVFVLMELWNCRCAGKTMFYFCTHSQLNSYFIVSAWGKMIRLSLRVHRIIDYLWEAFRLTPEGIGQWGKHVQL